MFITSWSRRLAGVSTAAVLAVSSLAVAGPAQAHSKHHHKHGLGDRSLATVLAKDGSGFDRRGWDFDILENAVLAVLGADGDSPVKILTQGDQKLTAFLPNDRAFRRLANDLFGRERRSERQVFALLADKLGVDTIEAVLLYHVVPGARIDYRTAKRSDGAKLTTALAGVDPLVVDVKRWHRWRTYVTLVDGDPNDRNAVVVWPNINKRNKQIAHGINRVLRPSDL